MKPETPIKTELSALLRSRDHQPEVACRCIGCGRERTIRESEITPDDYPCCESCGMPMIARLAKVRKGKQ